MKVQDVEITKIVENELAEEKKEKLVKEREKRKKEEIHQKKTRKRVYVYIII